MNNSQNQKQSQQQRHGYYMSQQHLKLMHLMHLSGYALKEYIANEVELNPVLEMEAEQDTGTQEEMDATNDDFDAELVWEEEEGLYEKSYKQQTAQREYYEAPVVQYNTLQENLKEQLHMLDLEADLIEIACYLVDELDDDGYLRRLTHEVADDYSFHLGKVVGEEKVKVALEALQQCEPAGIAARNLHECLLLQLRRRKSTDPSHELAKTILEFKYSELTQHQIDKIKSDLNITGEDLENCIRYISKLRPKPVSETNRYEQLKEQIIPDFEVHVEDSRLYVSLTSSEFIKLSINEDYLNYSKNGNMNNGKKQAENYFNNLVSDAYMLVNALKDREVTMLNVMRIIVQMQPDFFRSGDMKDLRPMILQDIADKTGYDISAISRITSNKHVQTPYGIFSLKNLFMRAIPSEAPGSNGATSLQVQELIQQIVKEEDKSKPLSDTDIMQLLKKKEISVARRTIVKYRELCGIPNSAIRRKQQLRLN
jgi:RNA polymerase sigma-54 factor